MRRRSWLLIVCISALVVVAACRTAPNDAATTGQKLDAVFETPPGWHDASRRALDLFTDGKHEAAIAIHEEWARNYPDFPDAHLTLADTHGAMIVHLEDADAAALARRKHEHLQAAAKHYRRYRSLVNDNVDDRRMATAPLARILSSEGLKELREAEEVAGDWVDEAPEDVNAYGLLAQIQRDAGKHDQAAGTLLKLKGQIRADDRVAYAELLLDHVQDSPALSRDDVQAGVEEALAISDNALAVEPKHVAALRAKSRAVRLQAQRLEEDPARRKALIAESDALMSQSVKALLGGGM